MSDIDVIRTLCADPIQYDRATFSGDGETTEFILPNSPVYADSESVYLDGAEKTRDTDYTIDDGLGLIIFIAPPTNGARGAATFRYSFLSDAQLQQLLDLEDGVPQLAAADALDIIASSEAIIQKKLKLLDMQTDGPALADSLRKHALMLREQVFSGKFDEPTFDIIEQVNDLPGYKEKIIKDWLRGQ